MKKLGLVLAFLVCFGIVDGFCGGNKEIPVIQKDIEELKASVSKQQETINKIDGLIGKIDSTLDKIDKIDEINDRLKEVEKEVFHKSEEPLPEPTVRRVPITMEIINSIIAHGEELGKLDYYLSAPLVLATNNQDNKGTIEEGAYILRENNNSSELRISADVKGKGTYNPGDKEQFEVLFSSTKLFFERNEQKNSFDFAYAEVAGKKYILSTTNKDEPVPQLSILYNYIIDNKNAIVAVQGIPASQTTEPEEKTADPKKEPPDTKIENANIQQGNTRVIVVTAPVPNPPRETRNAIRIEGRGSLEKNKIVDYILSQNSAAPRRELENLIDTYINEAKQENINWDIAVAQMCYATNFYRERQLISTRNYAGFGDINGVPVKYEVVNKVDQGVRAHIQHLKWYANGKLQGTNVNIDRRYNVLASNGYLGIAKTLDVLSGYWAPDNPNYGDGINRILRGLNES